MNASKPNVIADKTYAFALEIVTLYKYLVSKKEYVLSKQVLRSGTSIGANVQEAISSESKKDFIHKLSIAAKEARETLYWLNLLHQSSYITNEEFMPLNTSCLEIIKILNSIILTTKSRYFSNS